MSFSRMLAKMSKPASETGLVSIIHNEVLNPHIASWKQVRKVVESLNEAVKSDSSDKFYELFSLLYSMVHNTRPRGSHSFHFSTLEGDCPRMLWYDINRVPVSDPLTKRITNPKTLITFDQGTWFHLYAQGLLMESGVLIEAEVPVEIPKLKISSRADGIVKIAGEKRVLEIKTMNSFSYNKAVFRPHDYHLKQPMLYAYFLGIDKVHYLYYNKDTSEMKEFVVSVDMAIIQPSLDKMNLILEADVVMPRMCEKQDCERANQCPYQTHCFKK